MLGLWLALALAPGAPASGALPASPASVRLVQFNVWELGRDKLDETDDAGHGANAQLRKAAAILQTLRPDVLLVNEIDCDPADPAAAARDFRDRYLQVGQDGRDGLELPYVFAAPVNTGEPSGMDLDNDGRSDGPADAWGFGRYPGQYGLALLSRFPIDAEAARTFRLFRWALQPGHHMPDGRDGRPAFYSAAEAARLRLSSKTHWDVPVRIGPGVVHVVSAHPTPGVFDGPEDSNGRRNFDEIRMLADYVRGGQAAEWLVDDAGRRGGLAEDALFVVMGDMNNDPDQDPGPYGQPAVSQLRGVPRIQDPAPTSHGAAQDASPEASSPHPGRRTADYGRIDYVLPCRELRVLDAGVFWPATGQAGREWVEPPHAASDHHAVWVDVALPD